MPFRPVLLRAVAVAFAGLLMGVSGAGNALDDPVAENWSPPPDACARRPYWDDARKGVPRLKSGDHAEVVEYACRMFGLPRDVKPVPPKPEPWSGRIVTD